MNILAITLVYGIGFLCGMAAMGLILIGIKQFKE